MSDITEKVSSILAKVSSKYRGPGGAVAVLKDGEVVGKHAWGFADLHARTPMTTETVLPICSITKQMLCGLLTDLRRNPTEEMRARGVDADKQLSDELTRIVHPKVLEKGLTLDHLANNQSGVRDYWALTVLWGAKPEGKFSIVEHGPKMLERIKSLHFETGTQYSYSNTNFFIIGTVIENVTGRTLKDLIQERVFGPAGMKTAYLYVDTATLPGPCIGYEGDEQFGHWPGVNRIEWAGDAGSAASLEDMINFEKYVHANRDNADSWYSHNSVQQKHKNGEPANYGYGLSHETIGGVKAIGHGGALRGYRLNRIYAPDSAISVVAMLNEEHAKAGDVTDDILKEILGIPEAKSEPITPSEKWYGTYIDPESQLSIVVTKDTKPGKIKVKYHRKGMSYKVVEEGKATHGTKTATLEGDTLRLHVLDDNNTVVAQRVSDKTKDAKPDFSADLIGEYYSEEIDSTVALYGTGSMIYVGFEGFFGKGPLHFARPIGDDVWAMACPRGMDSSPPGDWTIIVRRDGDKVTGLTIGCWLARKIEYVKKQ